MPRPVSLEVLKRFYEDKETLSVVKDYFFAHLDGLGLEKVYAKEDTHGIADAKEILDNAFKQLEDLFEVDGQKKKEPINEAR